MKKPNTDPWWLEPLQIVLPALLLAAAIKYASGYPAGEQWTAFARFALAGAGICFLLWGLMEKRKRKMEAERQRQEEEARKKREEMLRVDEKVRRIEELHKRVMAAQKLADAASVKMGSPECVSFCAAGKNYNGIGELTAEKIEETVYKDRYGRMVLYTKERFPCFDSYDYLYEKRYFHTYLVRNEQRWTLIKAQDESDRISVREGLSGEQAKNALGSYAAQKLEKWLEKEM